MNIPPSMNAAPPRLAEHSLKFTLFILSEHEEEEEEEEEREMKSAPPRPSSHLHLVNETPSTLHALFSSLSDATLSNTPPLPDCRVMSLNVVFSVLTCLSVAFTSPVDMHVASPLPIPAILIFSRVTCPSADLIVNRNTPSASAADRLMTKFEKQPSPSEITKTF